MYPYIYILDRYIGTYGLCMVLGVVLAFLLALKKGRMKGLIFEDLIIVAAFAVGFGLLGGSLLYVFVTYTPKQIMAFLSAGDFRFLSSGIVFYGGLLGGVLGALIGVKVAKCEFGTVVRSVVPYIPLAHAIGRVGCVMAGCCHGFAYEGPFALHYPHSVTGLSPEKGYFPVQFVEALINLVICLFLIRYEKKVKQVTNLLFAYLGLYAASRFFLEMLRGDIARGIWYALSTSQIISVVLLCVSIAGLCWKKRKQEMPANKNTPLS